MPAAPANAQETPAEDAASYQAGRYADCMTLARENPTEALARAQSWIADEGGAAPEHCLGVALIGLGRYEEAALQLEKTAALTAGDPATAGFAPDLWAQAGQAWNLAGNAPSALAAINRALEGRPGDLELLIDRALTQATMGQYWEAIDDLNLAAEKAPGRADILILRATAYRALESPELALQDVEQALALQPGNLEGLLERGLLRGLAGDLEGARADWLAVVAAAPGTPAAAAAQDLLQQLDQPAAP